MIERPPIAILVKRFPKLSETFILSEVLALEALGWPVTIFTLLPPSDEIEHPDVRRIQANIVLLDQLRPACHLAQLLRLRGIRHLHAHFAGAPAEIGRAGALSAGIGYSVSAHAKDIYLTDEAPLRQNLAEARFVVTCTSHNAQHLRKIAPGVPVAKLYHGIDCAKLKPDPAARRADPPLILSVGRLRTKKGLDTLIDACARLNARDIAFRCEIIGYGPEEANLRQQAEQRGIGNLITFTGKMGHDDVLARMREASIFALPCRIDADGDRDGIPNVILEAMAMGLPVVSTPVSGVPEILSEGQTGWMVPPDDPEALAGRLEFLIAKGTDHAVTAAARKAVHSRFGEGRDIAMLDRLLLGAVGQGAAGIAYVIKGFPRLSESFISSEVLRLERLGKRITVFSLGKGDELAAPVLADMTSPLAYMPNAYSVKKLSLFTWLRAVTPAYLPIHWRLMRKRPRAWLSTFAQTVRFASTYRHPTEGHVKRSYFKQFLQAGAIAEALPRAGITHLHGHFCHNATTITWFAAQLAGCSFSFTAHAKDIYQEKHNPGDLLQRKINAASFVTTCTSANHEHLAAKLGELPTLHTVYHGLDTSIFRAVEREAAPMPRLIAVGRHVEKKGFDMLITALRILRKRGIILPCQIIGEAGPVTNTLATLIASSGLSAQISLDPPLPHAQLRECYGHADIFVLPCRIDESGDRDGIPNVLAEAMATGLAVISTNVSGIPELVRNGENGLLVAPDDAQALADAIARLAADPQLRAKLGTAAVETIHEVFDADRTILQMDELFGKALEATA
jgi:glycosyltransferase involved in cell wall biosynthesis